jgi:hypothetical protein
MQLNFSRVFQNAIQTSQEQETAGTHHCTFLTTISHTASYRGDVRCANITRRKTKQHTHALSAIQINSLKRLNDFVCVCVCVKGLWYMYVTDV